jgi:hypothetical protein
MSRIFLLALTLLLVELGLGIKIHYVHCNSTGKTYISLASGSDPCDLMSESTDKVSCCASKAQCSLADENNEDGCCDEEETTILYNPQGFSQYYFFIPQYFLESFDFSPFLGGKFQLRKDIRLCQHPQPPPLCVKQILTFHCIWRL